MSFQSQGRLNKKMRRTLKMLAAGWTTVRTHSGTVLRHPKRAFFAPYHGSR